MSTTLFIAQTPYHILLSLAMSSPGDTMQIIDDFQGSSYYAHLIEEHKPQLLVLPILPGRATTKDKMSHRVRYSRKNIRAMRELVNPKRFERIMIFNDRTPETQHAAFLAKEMNLPLEMVEDGLAAYVPSKEKDPSALRGFMSHLLFGRHYHNIVTMGTSPYVDTMRVFYPDLVIPVLHNKRLTPLDHRLFEKIPSGLVDAMTPQVDQGIECVLVLPHSEILGSGNAGTTGSLQTAMRSTAQEALKRYGKVAVKYHPREREAYLGEYEGCEMIPRQVPMEIVYLKLGGLKEVIGPLSTSLYTTRLILGDGVRIVATSNFDGPEAMSFCKKLKIETNRELSNTG